MLSAVAVLPTIVVVFATRSPLRLEMLVAVAAAVTFGIRIANSPFDVESSKVGLEVVPGSPGPAAVTKEGPASDLNVQLVEVGGVVPCWFGAKGAFAQDYVGIRGPSSLDAGIPVVLGAIIENAFGRDVDGIVVSAHECGGIVRRHVPNALPMTTLLAPAMIHTPPMLRR